MSTELHLCFPDSSNTSILWGSFSLWRWFDICGTRGVFINEGFNFICQFLLDAIGLVLQLMITTLHDVGWACCYVKLRLAHTGKRVIFFFNAGILSWKVWEALWDVTSKKRSDLEQRNVVRGPKAPYPLFRESEKPTKIMLQAFGEKKKGIWLTGKSLGQSLYAVRRFSP